MLTLVGSKTSPFVRFVRVVMEELSLEYKMELTQFLHTEKIEN